MLNMQSIIAEGEHKTQEFKEKYAKTMLKTVSAFANYHDGRIVIGINDQGQMIGVVDVEQERLKIENAINDSIRPRPYYEVKVYHEKQYKILVYTIYKGDRTPYTYNKKAYERNDTATLEIDKERYNELVLLGRNLSFEELPYEKNVTFELLSDKLSEALDIPTTDINVLKSLGLFKNGQYNNAASLIADQNDYKGKGMHLICYQDESMTRIIDRVSLENVSILKHFDACMNFYNKYVRQKDVIQDEKRITYQEVPIVAYREAVINAVVHRDYMKSASNRIEFFPDRIEILSVGSLPVGTTEEEYLNGSYSNLRNPIIADLFFRIGYIEKMGTGIRRIRQSYGDSSVKPVFKVMKNSILIILPFIDKPLDIDKKIKSNPDNRLSYEEKKLYEFFKTEERLTRVEVEEYLNVGKTKAVQILNQLIKKSYIKKIGNGRKIIYERKQ